MERVDSVQRLEIRVHDRETNGVLLVKQPTPNQKAAPTPTPVIGDHFFPFFTAWRWMWGWPSWWKRSSKGILEIDNVQHLDLSKKRSTNMWHNTCKQQEGWSWISKEGDHPYIQIYERRIPSQIYIDVDGDGGNFGWAGWETLWYSSCVRVKEYSSSIAEKERTGKIRDFDSLEFEMLLLLLLLNAWELYTQEYYFVLLQTGVSLWRRLDEDTRREWDQKENDTGVDPEAHIGSVKK